MQADFTSQTAPLVEVIALGQVSQGALQVAAANLQAIFELPAAVAPAWPEPVRALLPARGQYDAGVILEDLARGHGRLPLRLGILAADLCLPFLTHTFGEAQVEGRAAVVSLYRLRGGPEPGQMLTRLAKLALHETAHVLGLVHCKNRRCLMNFSPSLARLDSLEMMCCPACDELLAWQRARLLARPGSPSVT